MLSIKNMVCQCCIATVKRIMAQNGLHAEVSLGQVIVEENLTQEQIESISRELSDHGFELLEDPQDKLVEKIRTNVIEWVRMDGEKERISTFIQNKIPKDYSYLSKLFSSTRGMTIERFSVLQRIEYAKELISYSEETMSEIAFRMGYSSVAHLSTQFKRETGLTPKQFRDQHLHHGVCERKQINEI